MSRDEAGPGLERWPFALEKWYIDTLMPDGSVLLVYLARLRLFGIGMARVTADLFAPGQPARHGSATARRVERTPERLSFGPAQIRGETLHWSTPGLSGELAFVPRHPPVTLLDPFLEDGGRRLLWTVEIPDADVEGEIRWPGGGSMVRGRGYRDHVWFDFLPWRFPIRELRWGRAVGENTMATWVSAETGKGAAVACWMDGQPVRGGMPAGLELGPPRVLVESAVFDLEGLHLGLLRPLLRSVSGDPFEVKWWAPATIHGRRGIAVHEVVRWS